MKNIIHHNLFKSALLGMSVLASSVAFAYDRIVVLTPDVGDVLTAMGGANKIVGKDDVNRNPLLKNAKNIGLHRNLTVEPIVAMKPDLVVGSHMAVPTSIYQRLSGLGIKAENVAPDESVATYAKSIRTLGGYIGESQKANVMANAWTSGMKALPKTKKRYILSYDGRIVAGRGTVGDELIRRAGGINAANIDGLKPLSREGWLAANADVIIIAEHHKVTLGTVEQLKKRPELANSPAAKNDKIFYWPANDFLRYGLDSPQVLQKLHNAAK
ncbi:ABC transporter substrate-binding protein [Moraxella bovoculi]|uniref:ABC transporter substrate-binding protein n=1 Tax=Moraxella bovoculi TaxID=386891 RepID=A0AAC8PVW4_9GAMM|nr:ABC transporter substrate-binding protein [Moraxella bovoculi]AKG07958.1 ABC transporter substrate-binding protein [Moraxella bovoculi]AKG09506.1 ABC transporter substrate-binding protein [Moraxella bovoculi]AKG11321.1 ABC transporter substrate-binding protein [Moraxella bovoculi]AKG13329.1 ABC transporter substrate-binding protein [Moraxella bovoculi]